MTSRVNIWRRYELGTQDESTGEQPIDWAAVYVDHPFRTDGASSSDGGSRGVEVGGVVYEQATGVGHLPASTADLEDGDLIEVTSGEWLDDIFEVVAAVRFDQKTARRVPIVEAHRPKEWL